jgi:putative ABC transport system permease protein
MIKNYIKIAWRNILSNKLFSLINISGLSIGITCCALIYLYVQKETSFDLFHEKADRIYRINTTIHQPGTIHYYAPSSSMVAQRIQATFPEVSKVVRIEFSKRNISNGDKKFFDTKLAYADSSFFDIFTYPLLEGNKKNALTHPYSIVLTETAAKRYFGSEAAFGKTIKFSDTINLAVTGIIKDIPSNSHITFDGILSRTTLVDMNKNNGEWKDHLEKDWFYCSLFTYILLDEKSDYKILEQKINTVFTKEMTEVRKATGLSMDIRLQPLKDIHLKSQLEAEYKGVLPGNILYVYIFSAAALLILLIACSNFINLSTARSVNRSKEIGLRKVIGARRFQLVAQFLGESVIYTLIAGLISFVLLLVSIPLFNGLLETNLQMNFSVLWIYISIICVVGFLAGLYPALLMSSFTPIRSLKGSVKHGLTDIFFKKGLVIFQFSIAIVLIIGTSLILKQLDYIQSINIGLNKEHLVSFELKAGDTRRSEVIAKELSKHSDVLGVTVNGFNFKGISNLTLLPEGTPENEMTSCPVFSADENFIPTFQIKVVAGRNFSKDFSTDEQEAFIVNETAVKKFGWKTPKEALGKKIDWPFGKTGRVVGVVKDFNYASLHETIEPLLIHIFKPWQGLITVRLKGGNVSNSMASLENIWKKTATESPLKYSFLEDDFNSMYKSEKNLRNLLSAFTFLAIFVACLGLFGLASFTIKQRIREIGIRKVLGSSVSSIIKLLSKDFLKLVLVSIIIASPLAFYGIYKWLQGFAYKTEINWYIFFISGSLALVIAFLTVSLQALKAAKENPIKTLRTE